MPKTACFPNNAEPFWGLLLTQVLLFGTLTSNAHCTADYDAALETFLADAAEPVAISLDAERKHTVNDWEIYRCARS